MTITHHETRPSYLLIRVCGMMVVAHDHHTGVSMMVTDHNHHTTVTKHRFPCMRRASCHDAQTPLCKDTIAQYCARTHHNALSVHRTTPATRSAANEQLWVTGGNARHQWCAACRCGHIGDHLLELGARCAFPPLAFAHRGPTVTRTTCSNRVASRSIGTRERVSKEFQSNQHGLLPPAVPGLLPPAVPGLLAPPLPARSSMGSGMLPSPPALAPMSRDLAAEGGRLPYKEGGRLP